MRNKGFTLIELLAVIVILAIIALIAVPIVVNIINDSKKESINRSIELYIDHVQKMIAKEQMKDSTFNPSECEIKPEGILECKNETKTYSPIKIEMKGEMPKSGTIKFSKGMVVEGINLELDNLYYQVTDDNISEGTKEKESSGGAICTGGGQSTAVGTKYSCEVKPGKSFNFYVLSIEGDKVNLIMNSNICNDGTPADKDHECNYAWHWQTEEWDEDDNNYGPDIAMTNLYNATKSWVNVPDMVMNYTDENNKTDSTKGYTGITTDPNTKVTTIIGKQNKTSEYQTFGNTTEPLKARLPREDEVTSQEAGCHVNSSSADRGTCSTWLVENLKYYNVTYDGITDKYSMNSNNGITNIYGYWLLSSSPSDSINAHCVLSHGDVNSTGTSFAGVSGLRAVITVLKSDLS